MTPDEKRELPNLDRIIEQRDRELGEFLWNLKEKIMPEVAEASEEIKKVLPVGSKASEGTRTLEVMPEEVKKLYVQVLVAQTFIEDRPAPRQVADIYVFMSRIGLAATRGRRYDSFWPQGI